MGCPRRSLSFRRRWGDEAVRSRAVRSRALRSRALRSRALGSRALRASSVVALVVAGVAVPGAGWAQGGIGRRHNGTHPGAGKTFSFRPRMSGDGRFVAFDSDAPNLVPGKVNRVREVYVLDRDTGTLQMVSVGADGSPANALSLRPSISDDGRFVAFTSSATNLVAGDTNGFTNIFVRDRQTGTTTMVSVGSGGVEADGDSARGVISADGKIVAFESAATNLGPRPPGSAQSSTGSKGPKKRRNVYAHDMATGETAMVSVRSDGTPADGDSIRPSLSGDGRYVAFGSDAALAPGARTGYHDVYVHDRVTGQTTLVSVADGGRPSAKRGGSFGPSLSHDGRFVAFWSNTHDLVEGDTTTVSNVFVHDRVSGATELESVASDGTEADGPSSDPDISPDGRFVAFWSRATNLDPGRGGRIQIYVHDRRTGKTTRASEADDGTPGNDVSYSPHLSDDGSLVAFDSLATNLVPDDTNKGSDVFLHDQATGRTLRLSTAGPTTR